MAGHGSGAKGWEDGVDYDDDDDDAAAVADDGRVDGGGKRRDEGDAESKVGWKVGEGE